MTIIWNAERSAIRTTLLLGAIVIATTIAFPVRIVNAETDMTGICGENLTWNISNNTLTVSGTGEVEYVPWHGLRDQIKTVVINPIDDIIKTYITVYGPKGLTTKVQKKINQVMIDHLFIPEAIRVTYVPGMTLQYERNEIIYYNDLTKF